MQFRQWGDRPVSQMMLGTVQFGLPYGIANRTGQPSYAQVLGIIEAAAAGGVNCLDTAAAYGTSEEVLGRALRELGLAERMLVVTKVRPLSPPELADAGAAYRAIGESVEESRRRLQLDCLPLVLFHREADVKYRYVLAELKERGLIRMYGVSCDHVAGPAVAFAETEGIAALQIPGNVLDRRHQRSGVFQSAASRGVAVFIRSVYLQGLLLMPEAAVPERQKMVVPVRRRLTQLAADAGMTLAELAIRYMGSQDGVTCVVVGCETIEQVRANVAMFNGGSLDAGFVREIEAAVPDLPANIISPGLWNT